MTTGALPQRRVRFEYPDDLDPAWTPSHKEFACAANSVSLMMPYIEPYFVESVRARLPELEGDLLDRTNDYLGQERRHHQQHRRFNDILVARYPGLTRLERWLDRTYGWLGRRRSARFNLAFAASSETIAFAIARWTERHLRLFDDAHPVPTTLFLWHLAEEVEHKTAAYDVFDELDGSRLRYAWTASISLLLVLWFVSLGTFTMLWGERRAWRPMSLVRVTVWAVSLGMVVLPTLAISALPGHNPSDLSDPVFLPNWLARYDPVTGSMPLWTGVG